MFRVWSEDGTVKKFVKGESFAALRTEVARIFSADTFIMTTNDGTEIDDESFNFIVTAGTFEPFHIILPTIDHERAATQTVPTNNTEDAPIATEMPSTSTAAASNLIGEGLPLTYILPEFPEDIKRRLTNKREGVKNHETSTNTIITIIYQDMLKFLGDNPYPTSQEYNRVCQALVAKYPFLADHPGSGIGYGLWKNKLITKFKKGRKPLVTAEVINKRRKHAAKNRPATETISKDRSLVMTPKKKNPQQSLVEQAESEVSGDFEERFSTELSRETTDVSKLRELLGESRKQRSDNFKVRDIIEEFNRWPALKRTDLLLWEIGEVIPNSKTTAANMEHDFQKLLETLGPLLSQKCAKYQNAKPILEIYSDNLTLGLLLLPISLGEYSEHIYAPKEMDTANVSRQIIIQPIEEDKYQLLFDRVVICRDVKGLARAAAILFGMYYVFDLNPLLSKTYKLLEWYVGLRQHDNLPSVAKNLIAKLSLEPL